MLRDLQMFEGDLVDDGNGSLAIVEGAAAVEQSINHSMKLFLGEFFLEPGEGIDWFGLAEKPFLASRIRDAIIAQLAKEPAIESIEEFTIDAGEEPRSIKAAWVVIASGERISGSEVFS